MDMCDLSDFDALMNMPVEALEERIGAKLLEDSLGMKPLDGAQKRSAARDWWRSLRGVLRDRICEDRFIRERLFSPSEKDRNLVIAIVFDEATKEFTGIPAASLLALTCHYGVDKLCGGLRMESLG
jgi:hypothetical protein